MLFVKGNVVGIIHGAKAYDFADEKNPARRVTGANAKVIIGGIGESTELVVLGGTDLAKVEAAMKSVKIGAAVEWPIHGDVKRVNGMTTVKVKVGY